jgi:predicted PurR-regulated permease PerM
MQLGISVRKVAALHNLRYDWRRMTRSPLVRTIVRGIPVMDLEVRSTGSAPQPAGAMPWYRVLALPMIVLAMAVGLVLVWFSAASLLLLFCGILFASLLDACTRALRGLVPLKRPWRYALVVLVLGSAAALAIAWSVGRLPAQAQMLVQLMEAQLDVLEHQLADFGIDLFGPGRQELAQLLSDPGRLFGHVQYAVTGAYAIGMNTIIVVCLGLFFAAQPAAYREGMLSFVPLKARRRAREVMNEMGQVMRSWFLGQLVRSAVVALLLLPVFHFFGLPGAGLLSLQGGVATFVPYLGPLIAAFPIALVAMPLGLPTLAWVLVIYSIIQTVEGFVLAPLIQKGSVNVAPAWTLFAIVVLGAMFGALGVALAAPLLAVGRIAVLRFYVEDGLGDRQHLNGSSP